MYHAAQQSKTEVAASRRASYQTLTTPSTHRALLTPQSRPRLVAFSCSASKEAFRSARYFLRFSLATRGRGALLSVTVKPFICCFVDRFAEVLSSRPLKTTTVIGDSLARRVIEATCMAPRPSLMVAIGPRVVVRCACGAAVLAKGAPRKPLLI